MNREELIEYTAQIEELLRKLGYQGEGLGQLARDARPHLNKEIINAIRRLNKIRNHAVHQVEWRKGIADGDLISFRNDATFVIQKLRNLTEEPRRGASFNSLLHEESQKSSNFSRRAPFEQVKKMFHMAERKIFQSLYHLKNCLMEIPIVP